MFKVYSDLTKFGIVVFAVLAGIAGYATSFAIEQTFSWVHFMNAVLGLFFLSSGSLALNQAQEWKKDLKMPRTANRPIPSGKVKPAAAFIMSFSFLIIGSDFLYKASPLACALGWLTVIMYNGLYTYWWKPKWVFGAIPGAIPGALPVTIGYAANTENIFTSDSFYLFMILFLWQMPHFWALAIRYRDDYAKGEVPTMPVAIGVERTLFHSGLYTFLYLIMALAAPLFVSSSWFFLLLVFPFSFKVMQEFIRFFKSNGTKRWIQYFMWLNLSVLVFLFVPVIDKWSFLFIKNN